MNSREQAHQLIDQLPESQISALVGFLESIVDPVTAALRAAPLDDEDETEQEREAVTKARRSLERNGGKGISHGEAMRRLGLD
jgi:hypothetical protein